MKTYKEFITELNKFEKFLFKQGKAGSLTNQAMNKIDRFVGSRTMIKSKPELIRDTDIGKKTGEYIANKLKPQQIKGRKK